MLEHSLLMRYGNRTYDSPVLYIRPQSEMLSCTNPKYNGIIGVNLSRSVSTPRAALFSHEPARGVLTGLDLAMFVLEFTPMIME